MIKLSQVENVGLKHRSVDRYDRSLYGMSLPRRPKLSCSQCAARATYSPHARVDRICRMFTPLGMSPMSTNRIEEFLVSEAPDYRIDLDMDLDDEEFFKQTKEDAKVRIHACMHSCTK